MFGVTINGKHTFRDYGLRMRSYTLPMPEAKVNKVDIPYSDGALDQTEITGQVFYNDRQGIIFEFIQYDGDFKKYQAALQKLANDIHGKKVEVILDNDPFYFYVMRLSLSSNKTKKPISNITIEGTAEPYKYALFKVGDDWLWDPFSFVDGIIYKLENIEITEDSKKVIVPSDASYTVPEFHVTESNSLTLIFKGKSYEMTEPGTYYFPQVRMSHEVSDLTFIGTGKLSIDLRGRYL